MLDMKTTMVGFVLSTGLQLSVVAVLWRQHRKIYNGLNLVLLAYFLIFVGFGFIAAFNTVKISVFIVVSNVLTLGGVIILIFGMETFFERSRSWRFNVMIFVIVVPLTVYWTYFNPSMEKRLINSALGNFLIWSQIGWIAFYRIRGSHGSIGGQVGVFALLLALTTLCRVVGALTLDLGVDPFKAPSLITWTFLVAQTLFFGLTFSIILMVSRRLNSDLERDIVKREQSEARLYESQQKYSQVVNTMSDAVVIADRKSGIQFVNPAFCSLYQYTEEEALGMNPSLLVHPNNNWVVERFMDEVQAQKYFSGENLDVRKDGTTFFTDVKGAPIQFNGKSCLLAVVRDVSDRKEAELALRKSEENMASVLNNTPDAVVRIDKDFRHVFANLALYETTGLIPEEYLGKTNEEIGMPDDLCRLWREKFENVIKNGEVEVFEFVFPTASKGERTFQAVASPEYNEQETVETIISFMRDISDLKQVESEKTKAIQELERALSEVKALRGLIPICSKCKKIRDDEGYWNSLEYYFESHSDVSFSHGMCESCEEELYGEEDWYLEMKEKERKEKQ